MRRLQGLRQTVQAVAFAPDGRTLASAGNDKLIRLWDPATGKEVTQWTAHKHAVLCLAFSPDGRWLVSGGHDRAIKVREIGTGKVPRTLRWQGGGLPLGLAFTPDGRTLAAALGDRLMPGFGGGVQWWEVGPWQLRGGFASNQDTQGRTVHGTNVTLAGVRYGGCQGLAYFRDGRTLALATGLAGVLQWNTRTGRPVAAVPQKPCRAIAVAPDGKTIAAAEGRGINLWDVGTGTKRAILKGHGGLVWSVAFSPDGTLLLSGSKDKTVRFWDPAAGRELAAFNWDVGTIQHVAFAPDGMTAAVAGHTGTVVLCDVDADELRNRAGTLAATPASGKREDGAIVVKSHRFIPGLAFSPDGKTLAAVANVVSLRNRRGRLRGRIPVRGSATRLLRPGPCLAFAPDGRTLAVASRSRIGAPVSLWDLASGEVRAEFGLGLSGRSHPVEIVGLAFTPGGDRLIAGRRDFPERSKRPGLQLRHGRQGPVRVSLVEHHGSGLRALALSPDGTTLACATGEPRIRLWDVAAVEERPCSLGQVGACVSLSYAADNRTLAGAVGTKVLLWDTKSGAVRATLEGHQAEVRSVAFSPDGSLLLSGAADGVRLWDVAAATQRAHHEWPIGEVLCVSFAPDGKGAAAGGSKGIVLWDIEAGPA
jgi:WD40 repeat protein